MAGRKRIQYQQVAAPAFVPQFPGTGVATSAISSQIVFKNRLIYQAHTEPAFVPPEPVTESRWHQPWSIPVRYKIAAGLAIAIMTSGMVAPLPVPAKAMVGTTSPDIISTRSFIYQSKAEPIPFAETIAADKWFSHLSVPVRTRTFPTSEQQSVAFVFAPAPPAPGTDITTSAVSSQVTFKSRLIYQSIAGPIFVPPETVTPDKWLYPWSEPVRVKRFPTSEQQSLAYVRTPPSEVALDKWIYQWSDPVRVRRFPTSEQQAVAFQSPPIETVTPDKWIYPLSTPVRIRQFPTSEQQSVAFQPPIAETITADKWIYPWSEPVRQKPGLRAHLQQSFIGVVLDPETQILNTYESRWHYAWSEPVRLKRFPTSEQQSVAISLTPPIETVTTDKWIYPWSEPVRQKPGLKAYLQQAFIGVVLDPETQITNTYESRWHYAWSEPVRLKQFPVSDQQSVALVPIPPIETITPDKWLYPLSEPVRTRNINVSLQPSFFAPAAVIPAEVITIDKWNYAWSEPVRQKPGLRANLQQALISTVLNPETQIIQTYESRWHYAWSEPVRLRRFPTAEQQFFAFQPPSFEIVTVDKWVYPWSEPVKQKPGLRAHLQQAFIGVVLDPETQIIQTYESRWHYAWSEPIRLRQFTAAQQQSVAGVAFVPTPPSAAITTSALSSPVTFKGRLIYQSVAFVRQPPAEIITLDKWFSSLSLPVRTRQFPASGQQSSASPVFVPPEIISLDKWFSSLSLPVRQPAGLKVYLQQTLAAPAIKPVVTVTRDMWGYGWSEPVRKKPGLGAHLQQAAILQTPPFPNFVRTINWFRPLNEPVRLKRGIPAYLQRFFDVSQEPPPLNLTTLTLSGLETNSDSALFGVLVYSGILPATPTLRIFVSIEEIKAENDAAVSVKETKITDSGAVSIEET